jgi:hypothetical protein
MTHEKLRQQFLKQVFHLLFLKDDSRRNIFLCNLFLGNTFPERKPASLTMEKWKTLFFLAQCKSEIFITH